MRYLNWKDEYLQMGKPIPRPSMVELKKIKLQLGNNNQIVIPYSKRVKNVLRYDLFKITFELVEDDIPLTTSYYIARKNKKKNRKKW